MDPLTGLAGVSGRLGRLSTITGPSGAPGAAGGPEPSGSGVFSSSVSVLWGPLPPLSAVTGPLPPLPRPLPPLPSVTWLAFFFALCRRCLSALVVSPDVRYCRRDHATTVPPCVSPISSKALIRAVVPSIGHSSAAATRRAGMSNRPPSLSVQQFSRMMCHAAMAMPLGHPAVIAASTSFRSAHVPSYARYQRLTLSPSRPDTS